MAGCRNLCCSGLRGLPRLLGRGAPEEPKSKEKETGDSTENSVAGANTATDAQSNAEGSEFCGFLSKPEPCPIQVQPQNIARYSLPEEALSYVPEEAAVVMPFANGDKERLISCNIELSAEELRWLKELRKEALRQQKAFLPSVAVAAVRFLGDARGDVDVALREMEENQLWRLSYFPKPLQDTELFSDLKEGAVYFCGRDFALRPALVMRAGRVPFAWDAPRFARLFMFCMEYFLRYMAVPGRVENVVVIIDLQDISYRHMAIPALMELKEVFTHQNAGRVFCFYVCNMPFLVRALVNVVEAAMTERARQKIRFLSDVSQLREDFALNQLERDLGGCREAAESFFPFPLPPGPFSAGSPGSRKEAVGDLHQIMTRAGARGRLWDPATRSSCMEFADTARDFLRQHGLEHLLDQTGHVRAKAFAESPEQVDLSPEEVSLRCIFSCEPLFKLGCQIGK